MKKIITITLLFIGCFVMNTNAQDTKGIILENDAPATNNWSIKVMDVQNQQDADAIYNAFISKEGIKICTVNAANGVTEITAINDITDLLIRDIIHFAGYLHDSNFTGLVPENNLNLE